MISLLSRAELNTIGEGIMDKYVKQTRVNSHIDIDHFVINYLRLNINYISFAEQDRGKIGFLADGETPLMAFDGDKAIPCVFPKDTIVIDRFLLSEKEEGRRRFTIAHEAAHHILKTMQRSEEKAYFHNEFDRERVYTKRELTQLFAANEWQADAMGATFLMPEKLVARNLRKVGLRWPVPIYNNTVFAGSDKRRLCDVAKILGVSYTALVIRLKDLGMLRFRSIDEFIDSELRIGGKC